MKKEQTYILFFKDATGRVRDFNRFGAKQCLCNERKILSSTRKYLKNDLVRHLMDKAEVVLVELWKTDAAGHTLTARPAWSEKYSDLIA